MLNQLTDGWRLLDAVLAAAIVIWWSTSVGRLLIGPLVRGVVGDLRHPGDQNRSVWWIMGLAVLTFQIRGFMFPAPNYHGLRAQMGFMAQAMLGLALMVAVVVHQIVENKTGAGTVKVKRIIQVHIGMSLACAAVAFILR